MVIVINIVNCDHYYNRHNNLPAQYDTIINVILSTRLKTLHNICIFLGNTGCRLEANFLITFSIIVTDLPKPEL